MHIRPSALADLETIMAIYARARRFMAEHGNPTQWCPRNWPPEKLIRADIAAGKSYVCTHEGAIVGVFYFDQGADPDPGYRDIEDGAWAEDGPYGVVHRIASSGTARGVGAFCINWAYVQCGHLRMDTHGDNLVMQNLLTKLGFVRRGIVHVPEDDAPRIAYEKVRAV